MSLRKPQGLQAKGPATKPFAALETLRSQTRIRGTSPARALRRCTVQEGPPESQSQSPARSGSTKASSCKDASIFIAFFKCLEAFSSSPSSE